MFGKLYIIQFGLLLQFLTFSNGENEFSNPFDDMSSRKTKTVSEMPTIAETKYYILFAAAVDCLDLDLSDWNCHHCKKTAKTTRMVGVVKNSVYNTQGMVVKDSAHQEIVVAFRGSVNVRNYISDAMIHQMETEHGKNIKVHKGAWLAMMSLYDGIAKHLHHILDRHPKYKVVISGHSLGAMEASLFFFAFRNDKEFKGVKSQLYSYGQPRIGNLEFAQWVNSQKTKVVRVVNNNDITPHMLTTSSMGYVHFNTELWIQDGEKDKVCSRRLLEDPKCSNSRGPFFGFQFVMSQFQSNSDHTKYWDVDFKACARENILPYLKQVV